MRRRLVSYLFPMTAALLSVAIAACNRQGEHLTATGTELSSEFSAQNAPMQAGSDSASLPTVDLPAVDASASAPAAR